MKKKTELTEVQNKQGMEWSSKIWGAQNCQRV